MRATCGRPGSRLLGIGGLLCAVLGLVGGCGREAPVAYITHVIETPEGEPLRVPFSYPARAVMAVARHRPSGTVRKLPIEERVGPPRGLRIERAGTDEEVLLWVSGCLDLALPSSETPTPVRLVYGPRVQLRVRTDGEIPAKPFELQLSVRRQLPPDSGDARLRADVPSAAREGCFRVGERSAIASWTNPSLSGTAEVEVRFSGSGAHRVEFVLAHVEQTAGGRVTSEYPIPDADLSIDVQDGVAEQTIDLEVSGAALVATRKSLGK